MTRESRVLITGASGFVGQHAVRCFARAGWQVHGLARHAQPDTPGCQWHAGDMLDVGVHRPLLHRVAPTHLVHLAWTTQHGCYWSDPRNHDWVDASLALFKEFAHAGGRHAFMAGSCAEYDWSATALQTPGTPLRPATLYGRCKAALGQAAQDCATSLGIGFTWGRLFFPFGPGERAERLIPYLTHCLLSGETAATGPAQLERDFVYVEDLVDMIYLASERSHSGMLDLCSGVASSIGEVAEGIARRVGRPELLQLGRLRARAGDPDRIVGNGANLRALGWTPRFDLSQGLDRTVEWWRQKLAMKATG